MFFADSATVPPDGKLYVLGGGFSGIAVPQLPAQVSFAVVAGFRFRQRDAGVVHAVELRFVDADGKFVVPPATLQFQAGPGAPELGDREVSVPTVSFLAPTFGVAGTYTAELWADGHVIGQSRLNVEEQTGAQPEPPV